MTCTFFVLFVKEIIPLKHQKTYNFRIKTGMCTCFEVDIKYMYIEIIPYLGLILFNCKFMETVCEDVRSYNPKIRKKNMY